MPRVKTKPSRNGDIKPNGLKPDEAKADDIENDVDSAVGGTVTDSVKSDEIEEIDCSDNNESEKNESNNNSGLNTLLNQFYDKDDKEENGSGGSPASDNDSNEGGANGRGLSMINPKIYTWMATKFCIEEGARTAVQEIIAQYKEDFPKESLFMPLQTYQVGQLVRKHFPNIGRCKISQNGKRVWVYKDLGKRNFQSASLSDNLPTLLTQFDNQKNEGKSENFNALQNLRDLPTMINLLNPSGNTNGDNSLAILPNESYDDSFGSPTPSKRIKTKHVSNHTIDNQVVAWIRDHYEASEGFFVKSLELLAHFNSGNPRKPLQNLSQVGRLLKNSINQNCKHLRRYFKGTEGGKREWVYTNIRVKPESLMEFNHAIEGKIWVDNKSSINRPDSSLTSSSFDDKASEELKNLRNVIIATVQQQQEPSIGGSENGENAESNNSEMNGNLPFDDFNKSNDSNSFDKFKSLRLPGWQMTSCSAKYVEWIRCENDFLINRKRIIIEVRILNNWDFLIYANGRRVYPESIGVSFIDHSLKSVTEFMMGLAKIKFCRGFPAPLYRPLELQGHVVSSVEIWSRRSDEDVEEIRHRALNCSLLFNSDDNFCNSCFHICRLNMQRVTSRGSATISINDNDSNARVTESESLISASI